MELRQLRHDRADRSPHHRQPHQPQLLQSGRRALGRGIFSIIISPCRRTISSPSMPARSRCRSRLERWPKRRSTSGPASRSARGSATTIRSLRVGRGYDHNFCLGPAQRRASLCRAARRASVRPHARTVHQPARPAGLFRKLSRRLDPRKAGGRLYRQSDAMCLEPHAWPDTPNRPDFPTAACPGDVYRHITLYRFTHAVQGHHGAIETQSAVDST